MKKSLTLVLTLLCTSLALVSAQDDKHAHAAATEEVKVPTPGTVPSPDGAETYIISPKDGDTVKGPVTVVFGLKGMGVCPAGLYLENTGHHHLLINTDLSEVPGGIPMPTLENKLLHFGKGQTETVLELEPGTYTLQLAFADHGHMLHNPPVISKKITITVE